MLGRNIRHAAAVFEIIMAMIGRIRIENRLAALDGEAADETHFSEKIEDVIDRRQRGEHPRFLRLGRQNVGRDVAIALAEQKLGQAQPLPRGTQAIFLQQRADLRRASAGAETSSRVIKPSSQIQLLLKLLFLAEIAQQKPMPADHPLWPTRTIPKDARAPLI